METPGQKVFFWGVLGVCGVGGIDKNNEGIKTPRVKKEEWGRRGRKW